MFTVRFLFFAGYICLWHSYVKAEVKDLQNCEAQLNMYRKFIMQLIPNFEDVCDAYNSKTNSQTDSSLPPPYRPFFGRYQPSQQKTDAWSFFKALISQFNDIELTNIIHDAVTERCIKLQLQQQRGQKRNTVVLGKKQKFHSWGGKRSTDGISAVNLNNYLEQELNDDINLRY